MQLNTLKCVIMPLNYLVSAIVLNPIYTCINYMLLRILHGFDFCQNFFIISKILKWYESAKSLFFKRKFIISANLYRYYFKNNFKGETTS